MKVSQKPQAEHEEYTTAQQAISKPLDSITTTYIAKNGT